MQSPPQFCPRFNERYASCWIEWKIHFQIFFFELSWKFIKNLGQKWPWLEKLIFEITEILFWFHIFQVNLNTWIFFVQIPIYLLFLFFKCEIFIFLVVGFAPHPNVSRGWEFFFGLVDPSWNRLASTTYSAKPDFSVLHAWVDT